MKYWVNGIGFPTKAALTKHVSAMLGKGVVTDDDHTFLLDLIERHPDRDIKVGCGIARFFVAASGQGTNCFWLERLDGSTTDFSFKSCITAPSHESDVRQALRGLITGQVIAFRDSAFMMTETVPCAITGVPVASPNAHVDHRPPKTFLALIRAFLASESVRINDVGVEGTVDGVTSRTLLDVALAERWCRYHRENCDLQIVTKRANLSQGSRTPKVES